MVITRIAATLTVTMVTSASFAANGIVGSFESLDGKFKHHFEASGDYSGQVQLSDSTTSASGIYQSGSGVCWTTNRDGSRARWVMS